MQTPSQNENEDEEKFEFIHCNKKIAKKATDAIHQLEEDYFSFFTHHQEKIYFVDDDAYKTRDGSMTEIQINFDSLRRKYAIVQRNFSELIKRMTTDNNKKSS